MEVILLKDVKGLGKKGESKTVSDGYAKNFLIPRKLVVRKTEESLAELGKDIHINEMMYVGHGEEKSNGREKNSLIAFSINYLLKILILNKLNTSFQFTVIILKFQIGH